MKTLRKTWILLPNTLRPEALCKRLFVWIVDLSGTNSFGQGERCSRFLLNTFFPTHRQSVFNFNSFKETLIYKLLNFINKKQPKQTNYNYTPPPICRNIFSPRQFVGLTQVQVSNFQDLPNRGK